MPDLIWEIDDRDGVFLTFDDWGTDRTITRLLEVLKAHGAKATFFVKTQYVPYNPNLLRAIAADGHTIGCHTNTHFPLSNDVGSGKRFTGTKELQLTSARCPAGEGGATPGASGTPRRTTSRRSAGTPSLSKKSRPISAQGIIASNRARRRNLNGMYEASFCSG